MMILIDLSKSKLRILFNMKLPVITIRAINYKLAIQLSLLFLSTF